MTTTVRPVSDAPTDPNGATRGAIARPRFFAGQLLTDVALTGLTDWARARLALLRLRDGWGVVCGLDAWAPPNNRATLAIGPGYAVSCRGDDLYLADALTFDFTRISQGPPAAADSGALCQIIVGAPKPSGAIDPVFNVPADEVRVFDLYLRTLDAPCAPQPSPSSGRGKCCSDATGCDDTVSREDVTLAAFAPPVSPPKAPFAVWSAAFTEWAAGVNDFLHTTMKEVDTLAANTALTPDASKALAARVAAGARHFPFLIDRLGKNLPSKDELLSTLTWLVLDERAALLERLSADGPSCDGVPGVPVARVWVHASSAAGKASCQVLAVSTDAPYRRPVGKDERWPSPAFGAVNLGRFLGARWTDPGDDLAARLRAFRVQLATGGSTPFAPASLAEIARLTALDPKNDPTSLYPFPSFGGKVTPVVFGGVSTTEDRPIVVGFAVKP